VLLNNACRNAPYSPHYCKYCNNELSDLFILPENKEDKIKYWTDGEIIIKRNRLLMESTLYLGEAYPHINLNLGASGHAGFFKGA
jgi:hypothetical protein